MGRKGKRRGKREGKSLEGEGMIVPVIEIH